MATVELHIRPPLSYGFTKEAGGFVIRQEVVEGETLGDLLARLVAESPAAYGQIYELGNRTIRRPVVTVVNGTIVRNTEAINQGLADGDRITWLLVYAGG